jgi:HEAT repeat protein
MRWTTTAPRWISNPALTVYCAALAGLLSAATTRAAGAEPAESKPDPAQEAAVRADEQTLMQAKLGTDGPALLDFFRKRTVTDADLAAIQALVRQLGDDSFEARQKATAELIAKGRVALPLLQKAKSDPDIEIVRRAEECIRQIEQGDTSGLIQAAARLVGVRKPAGAADVLLAYIPMAESDYAADQVQQALAAVAMRDGKPEPVLVKALTDKQPVRRAAAAVALCRAGALEQRPAVRKMLEDPDPTVRLRVGLALVALKEKDAVPVLIKLLAELPTSQVGQVEEVLYQLAEDKAPTAAAGSDDAQRKKYRDAWEAWWRDNGDKIDLAKLDLVPKLLGYTMLVLLDEGKLLEVDAQNKVRWEIGELQFPLDAQLLPGDRVLVAENAGNRVTERDIKKKGEILWQKAVEAPIMAQRLPNGNTFIATRAQLIEVDKAGKQVFQYSRPNGEMFMRAQKLRNGDIACVTVGSVFIRMDATGKELLSFPVDIRTSGGRIDVLPDGRVLVPQLTNNKVVEQDAQGKVTWEAMFDQPIAAVRLPNGNTLVTSYSQHRAVELDRDGKQVWEYKAETRVTRAWRR